jgi:hypothetical protein
MAISFVAATDTNSSTNGTSLSISKPSGVTSGDVVIIAVGITSNTFASQTVNAPSGFTKLNTTQSTNSNEVALCVMAKLAGGSEPASYTVTWTQTSNQYYAVCAAYRGATGTFIAQNAATEALTASPLSTPSVTNTNASAWRITVGYFADGAGDTVSAISTNETTRRGPASGGSVATDGGYYYGIQFYDSNGVVAAGSHNRSFSGTGASFWTAVAWIGLLEPGSATPATGVMSTSIDVPQMSGAGSVTVPGTLATSIDVPAFAGTGNGQPQASTGTMSMAIDVPTFSGVAAVPPIGTLATTVEVQVAFVGETRTFGVRVIQVDAESRTIRVQSRGVDD